MYNKLFTNQTIFKYGVCIAAVCLLFGKEAMPRVQEPLKEYKKKRDLKKSPEPKAKVAKKSKNIFVIQKHAASHLHYDLRLAIDGVLKSWAVPKGPSMNTKDKRLAMLTEDHPMKYATFEGVIPAGLYGAGVVMVWDKGTFRDIKKPANKKTSPIKQSFKDGQIEVFLKGKKVYGGFALVKIGKDPSDKRWLLIKMRDEYATDRKQPYKDANKSVKTGRTMVQIKKDAALKVSHSAKATASKTKRNTAEKKKKKKKNE
ncbi:MAG TPA: DNA polymerase ligase N-terminal domain-containing protein [Candidatus Dependentiae bacterium]|nr:DNA polymerase ligase N-terminal domain-containing protein [Candidatus Dependentiae bacterium]HRQ63157.1 DNA polymerase ligase N-terminal domain-containing protein [Candidatus Dependentiae bacterium]